MNRKIILNLLILSFMACKKNSSTPADRQVNVKFRPEGLEYVKLDTGKYLIYKDPISGGLDSVRVTQSLLENKYYPAHRSTGLFDPDIPAYNIEAFTLILEKFDGLSRSEWFHGNATASTFGLSSDSADIDMQEPDYSPAFFYSSVYYPDNLLIPSITVEGKTYADVIKHIYDNGLNKSDTKYKKSIYYWTKQIGIIKREVITTNGSIKTFTLLRNN